MSIELFYLAGENYSYVSCIEFGMACHALAIKVSDNVSAFCSVSRYFCEEFHSVQI